MIVTILQEFMSFQTNDKNGHGVFFTGQQRYGQRSLWSDMEGEKMEYISRSDEKLSHPNEKTLYAVMWLSGLHLIGEIVKRHS